MDESDGSQSDNNENKAKPARIEVDTLPLYTSMLHPLHRELILEDVCAGREREDGTNELVVVVVVDVVVVGSGFGIQSARTLSSERRFG